MKKLKPVQIILMGFLLIILIGSLLLTLPIASKSGTATNYVDALFTATTSVCVTGLVTVPTVAHWSLFGQVVILLLIQIGGLGVITMVMGFLLILGKRVTMRERILIQESYGLNEMSGLVKLIARIFQGVLVVEGMGSVAMATQFVPEFGWKYGIWASVFNSVSAFCNAGIDIVKLDSMRSYVFNPVINFSIMALITLGGLGFIVWRDCVHIIKQLWKREIRMKDIFRKLSLHSKIVIVVSMVLVFGGAFLIFIFEYNNPKTMADYSLWHKIQASLFQSVTTRTAGFESIAQANLSEGSSLISMILMFIGGSPVGTAGGVKTITLAIVVCCVIAVVKQEKQVILFKRGIAQSFLPKAITIICVNLTVLLTSILLILISNDSNFMETCFESISALATVGLTKGLTPNLNDIGKIVIICTMYLGRVGPVSLALGFTTRGNKKLAKYPEENITLG
ncbi:MAG: potassium transporter TrkG [Anaerostipes sp.]|nr:potassium transporter TrkG [Anaerostipes sp.]